MEVRKIKITRPAEGGRGGEGCEAEGEGVT